MGNFISTFVLILTLLVLIFYTVATFGLRKAATEQLELSLRPFIIIDVEEDAAMLTRTLIYKNIVHGPAIDIQIVPFDAEEYILNFETHGLMEVGETKKNEYKTPRKESAV